jgi:hypothetical protein
MKIHRRKNVEESIKRVEDLLARETDASHKILPDTIRFCYGSCFDDDIGSNPLGAILGIVMLFRFSK